jgi:hypothetical protein
MPVPPKRKKLNAQQRFLAAYIHCGEISVAAEQAGIARARHYEWLAENPEYRKQFEEVEDIAVARLLSEVRRRAVDGIEEPVIYQGGLCYPTKTKGGKSTDKPLTIRKYSDNLLMFLVKGKRPEYRDNWRGELSVKADLQATHNIDLTKLSDDKLNHLITILESAAGDAAATGYTLAGSSNGKGHAFEESDN